MAGSWWADHDAQADRNRFSETVASRSQELRNDRRFGTPTTAVNIITSTDERGMFAEYRKQTPSRTRQGVVRTRVQNSACKRSRSVGQLVHQGSAAQFVAAIQARAGVVPAAVEGKATSTVAQSTEGKVQVMAQLKLKGVTKYAAVYTIPGVPGQLMIRKNMFDGEAPDTLELGGEIEFKPADPKVIARQEKQGQRAVNAEQRAQKAAERAEKALERARKAQELAARIKAKAEGRKVEEPAQAEEPVAQ